MGKATRWLKSFLGMKKEKERERDCADSSSSISSRKRWSFGKSGRGNGVTPQIRENLSRKISVKDDAWLRSYLYRKEKEQNKHAIAVAAATAAAADAAVTAAQAAMAVVRLTGQEKCTMFRGGRERWAAIKIQTVFRGYLARKARRALKGLVKLQALVRGHLVRKQASAALYRMQALIRAQNAVQTHRARRSLQKENRFHPENRTRKSIDRIDDKRNEFHSKRLSASYEMNDFDESPKIVEIDTFKTRSRSRRTSAVLSEYSQEFPYQAISFPLPCPMPARICIPNSKNHQDFEWGFTGDECKLSTAQCTPRFANSVHFNGPATPAKSAYGENYFRPYSNFPSYMANTQSFNAKLRSHSAPKQRPEPGERKRLSLNEIMASRNSISSVRMQRTCPHIDEDLDL